MCRAGAIEAVPEIIPQDWYFRKPDDTAAAALNPLHIHTADTLACPGSPVVARHPDGPPRADPGGELGAPPPPADDPSPDAPALSAPHVHGPDSKPRVTRAHGDEGRLGAAASQAPAALRVDARAPGAWAPARPAPAATACHALPQTPPQLRVCSSGGAGAAWDAWSAYTEADMHWLAAAATSPASFHTPEAAPAGHACRPRTPEKHGSLHMDGMHGAHAQRGHMEATRFDDGSAVSDGVACAPESVADSASEPPAAWLFNRVVRGAAMACSGARGGALGRGSVEGDSWAVQSGGGDAVVADPTVDRREAAEWAQGVVEEGRRRGEVWLRALEVAMVQQRLQETAHRVLQQSQRYLEGA